MTVPIYLLFAILAAIILVIIFATGAFFSKSLGVPLGLAGVVCSTLGVFFATVASAAIMTIVCLAFLLLSAALALAALGGE